MHDLKITFDGLVHHDGDVAVRDGFKGFDWNNVDAIDKSKVDALSAPGTENGFQNVLKSGDSVASACKNDNVSTIKSDGFFTFKSGWFAAAWMNDMTVTFTAYRDGVEVGHLTTTLGIDAKFLTFSHDFRHIDKLTIATSGGTDAFPGDGASHELAMEDLGFGNVHQRPVPDPVPAPDFDLHHHFLTRGFVHDHHVFLV